jgi:hypothetical protein
MDQSNNSIAIRILTRQHESVPNSRGVLGQGTHLPTSTITQPRRYNDLHQSWVPDWCPRSGKSHVISSEQGTDQAQMMMLVPIYFQVSAHASLTNAGAHLMPSVIGNAVGGLLVGYIINKSALLFHILNSQLTSTEPANTKCSPLSGLSLRSHLTLL